MNMNKVSNVVVEQEAEIADSESTYLTDEGIDEFHKSNFFLHRL